VAHSIDWEPIDELLFDRRVLDAIAHYREAVGCGLQQATTDVPQRIGWLMEHESERFRVPLEGYGDGFYS